MKMRPKTKLAAALGVGMLGLLLWLWAPVREVFAIANLTDPAKLAALGKRGANAHLNKVIYWLDKAHGKCLPPSAAIFAAQVIDWVKEPRASLVKSSLIRNLKIAHELGLLTPENRERLRHGHAAVITRGPYSHELAEVDHIIPLSLAPEIGNELANLEILPQTLNRQKADRVTARQLTFARQLWEAGLLSRESWDRVRAKGNSKTLREYNLPNLKLPVCEGRAKRLLEEFVPTEAWLYGIMIRKRFLG